MPNDTMRGQAELFSVGSDLESPELYKERACLGTPVLGRVFDAGIILVGRVGMALGGIIAVRVSTELLSPAQFAGVTQLTSVTAFFNLMFIVPVWHYVLRGFSDWHESGVLIKNIRRYVIYVVIVALAGMAITRAAQSCFDVVNGFSTTAVVILVGLYLGSSSISTLGTTGLNVLNRRIHFVIFSNIPIWFGLGLSIALFSAYASPSFWSLGQFTGLSVACLSLIVLLRELKKKRVVSPIANVRMIPFTFIKVFEFAWPAVVTTMLWWIQSQSYKFILDKTQGPVNVGLFAVGYGVAAGFIALYEGIFGQFYEPIYLSELKGRDSDGQARAWNKFARAYVPGIFLMGAFVAGNGTFLARLFLGEQFRDSAAYLIVWAAMTESLRAAGSMFYNVGFAKMDMRVTIAPVAAGAVLAPLGVLLLGRIDPIAGTAIGLFVAGIVVFIVGLIMSQKVLPITWPVRRIGLAFLLSIPLLIGNQLAVWIAPRPTIWWALGVLLCSSVYLLGAQILLFASLQKERAKVIVVD